MSDNKKKSESKSKPSKATSTSSRSKGASSSSKENVARVPSPSIQNAMPPASSQVSLGMDPGVTNLGQNRLYDVIQMALICRQHRAMLFANMLDCKGLYFPFVILNPGETAHGGSVRKLKDLISRLSLNKSNLTELILVDILRIEIAPHNEYICRYTFLVEEKKGQACLCNNHSSDYTWVRWNEEENTFKKKDIFWGAEPFVLLDKILTQPSIKEQIIQEMCLYEQAKYLSDEVKASEHPLTGVLMGMEAKPDDLYRLFLDYLSFTYPSLYMNQRMLQEWREKTRFALKYKMDRLFASWQIDPDKDLHSGYIDFDEFLFGVMFMDHACPNEGIPADIRCSYFFRYCKRGKNHIEYEDILALCQAEEGIESDKPKAAADAFWNEVGLRRTDKEANIDFTKFKETLRKLNQHFNLGNMLRAQEPILEYERNIDLLKHGVSLCRDQLDICKKRDAYVCVPCSNKEPPKWSEHSIKVFYNGAITEIFDNDKLISDMKLRATKAKRKASRLFFANDHFPHIMLEAMYSAAEPTLQRNSRVPKEEPEGGRPQVWSGKFAAKNLAKIIEMMATLEKLENATKLNSPCAVCPELSKLNDLFVLEHNISHLVTVVFPIQYVCMITVNDLQGRNGLELILSLVAYKALLPEKFHIIFPQLDEKKQQEMLSSLTKQSASFIDNKDDGKTLGEAVLKFIKSLPNYVLIDNAVYVVSGVVKAANIKESLDILLNPQGSVEAPPNPKQKSKAKSKSRKTKSKSKSASLQTKGSSIDLSPNASQTSLTGSGRTVGKHVIFTTNEPKKMVYVRDEQSAILQLGKNMPSEVANKPKQMCLLVENEKIRPIYYIMASGANAAASAKK